MAFQSLITSACAKAGAPSTAVAAAHATSASRVVRIMGDLPFRPRGYRAVGQVLQSRNSGCDLVAEQDLTLGGAQPSATRLLLAVRTASAAPRSSSVAATAPVAPEVQSNALSVAVTPGAGCKTCASRASAARSPISPSLLGKSVTPGTNASACGAAFPSPTPAASAAPAPNAARMMSARTTVGANRRMGLMVRCMIASFCMRADLSKPIIDRAPFRSVAGEQQGLAS